MRIEEESDGVSASRKHLVFAYYVTGHGFGHATRVTEVSLSFSFSIHRLFCFCGVFGPLGVLDLSLSVFFLMFLAFQFWLWPIDDRRKRLDFSMCFFFVCFEGDHFVLILLCNVNFELECMCRWCGI